MYGDEQLDIDFKYYEAILSKCVSLCICGRHVTHTLLQITGGYMAVDTGANLEGVTSYMITPQRPSGKGGCLMFDYFLESDDSGKSVTSSLIVSQTFIEHPMSGRQLWKAKGKLHQRKATVHVPSMEEPYFIVFQGLVGDPFTTTIAITNVKMTEETCESSIHNQGKTIY